MKRRRILGAMAGMVGLPGAASGTSLYGTPASIGLAKSAYPSDPLHLVLDADKLPPAISGALASFGGVWERVLTNADEKARFQRDPAAYLKTHGIPESVLGARDQEIRLLLAICDEQVLSASIRGDYAGFLGELAVGGHPLRAAIRAQEARAGSPAHQPDGAAPRRRGGAVQ